jgi:hypothetical protein
LVKDVSRSPDVKKVSPTIFTFNLRQHCLSALAFKAKFISAVQAKEVGSDADGLPVSQAASARASVPDIEHFKF